MRLSIASAILFFYALAGPALAAPVPGPLSDTTGTLTKREIIGQELERRNLFKTIAEVGSLAIPGVAEERGALAAVRFAGKMISHIHHNHQQR
ncbi:hypothetical protein FRC18_006881 [Serendipita sp. 400]|nr:hypothetical protein FRC18_006881 [Serendipita sp. 400]